MGVSNSPARSRYKSGDFIVSMGEPADSLYFIKEGEVSCHQGGEELVRLRAPPPFVLCPVTAPPAPFERRIQFLRTQSISLI